MFNDPPDPVIISGHPGPARLWAAPEALVQERGDRREASTGTSLGVPDDRTRFSSQVAGRVAAWQV